MIADQLESCTCRPADRPPDVGFPVTHPIAQSTPPSEHWPKVAASIAVFRKGEVLLGLRGKDPKRMLWSLPGGHIEPGETAREAALRELTEETSVAADLLGLIDINDIIVRDDAGRIKAHYLLTIFFGTWTGGEPSAADDCADARFFALNEIAGLETTERLSSFVTRGHAAWAALHR